MLADSNNDGVFRRHDTRHVWRHPYVTRFETRGDPCPPNENN
jgi:hypothetical protein